MINISDLLSMIWENNGIIKDTPAVIEAEESLKRYMLSKGIPEYEYDEFTNTVATQHEEQGFVNGFRCAVGLLMDGLHTEVTA